MLDPFQPVIFSLGAMGMANYMLKRYDALRLLRECASRLPNFAGVPCFSGVPSRPPSMRFS
jgi:hypothetical protein